MRERKVIRLPRHIFLFCLSLDCTCVRACINVSVCSSYKHSFTARDWIRMTFRDSTFHPFLLRRLLLFLLALSFILFYFLCSGVLSGLVIVVFLLLPPPPPPPPWLLPSKTCPPPSSAPLICSWGYNSASFSATLWSETNEFRSGCYHSRHRHHHRNHR